jgi:hypothetical protein
VEGTVVGENYVDAAFDHGLHYILVPAAEQLIMFILACKPYQGVCHVFGNKK